MTWDNGEPLERGDVPGLGPGEQARLGVRMVGGATAVRRPHPAPADRTRSKIVSGDRTPESPPRPWAA